MKLRFKLNENLINEDEQFYDYGTAQVSNDQIFDTTKTGMSFYDNFLNDKDLAYMQKSKNLDGKIVQMSPNEYFDEVAKIFKSSRDYQIEFTAQETDNINKLINVITKHKKRFPIGFINYADNQQEGRHRMYVAGKLFGFDHKFPVLIVDWFDKTLQAERDSNREIKKDEDQIIKALSNSLDYKYRNLNDFISQLESEMSKINDEAEIKYSNKKAIININDRQYEILFTDYDTVSFSTKANEYDFEDSINFYEDDYEPDDLDDLDDLLMDMSDEELNQYAKDNFGISLH